MNDIYIPYANPVSFYEMNPTLVPQYMSKAMDRFPFAETQNPWDHFTRYRQKWARTDTTYIQLYSDFDPIEIHIVDIYDVKKATISPSLVRTNRYKPGFFLFEFAINWAAIADGCYFLKIVTALKTMISEPIEVRANFPNTLFYSYRNSRYHRDVIYETGIRFGFRVDGSIGRIDPGSNDEYFTDQKANPYLLKSSPFYSFPIKTGGSRGVPDWFVRIYHEMWSCNDVTIDGISYAKTSELKFDFKELERYPMRGIEVKARDGINRGSKLFTGDVDPNKKMVIVYGVPSDVFGNKANANGEIIPLVDTE